MSTVTAGYGDSVTWGAPTAPGDPRRVEPEDEKMTLPALLRDLNRQLSLARHALASKDERACRLQLGLMLDNLSIEFPEWSP